LDRTLWRCGLVILRPGQALAEAFKRAFDFQGRSRRSAYWWFALFNSLGGITFGIIDEYVTIPGLENWAVFYILYSALIFVPDCALGIRRLHDTGRKGWPYIVWVIVIYGLIFLPEPNMADSVISGDPDEFADALLYDLVYSGLTMAVLFLLMLIMIFLLTRDSQSGQNQYGSNPKGIGNPDVFS
jgi:uncharacterized membrane protein YhaH (DUF805 family)